MNFSKIAVVFTAPVIACAIHLSSVYNGTLTTAIQILAAGADGSEMMQLVIDGNVVQEWTVANQGAPAGEFELFEFVAAGAVTADQVQIAFVNDEITRDLRVDKIVIGGVEYQSEAENVFSTGTFAYGECSPGYYSTEWLHCNGYLQYSASPRGPGEIPAAAGSSQITDQWSVVVSPVPFVDPVVLVGPASRNDLETGSVSVRFVDSQGFDVRFQEWINEDGPHAAENLDWLLLPVGRFTSHDGSEWEIGKFELSGNGTFQQQIFATPFLQTPKVFLTIQTNDGDAPLVVRADQVDRFGFQAALFTEELLAGFDLIAETVGYVAVDPAAPSGVVAMGDTVFPYLFEELAVGSALASSAAGYSLIADEERSADGETEHPAEPTNALRLVELTFAQDFALASTDPFSYRIEKVPGGVTLAPGFQLQQLISGNEFDNAVDLAVAPDGRIFVAEEGGRVWIVQNGVRLPTPYLDLSAELFRAEADEGALSAIALDPNFATNRFFYVLYPVEVNGVRFGRLRRYKSFSNNHNLANPATKKDLLGSSASNGLIVDVFHNVGDIQFGTDRTLLVSWGDAAGNDEDDPGQFRSQQFDVPAGKLFRINSKDGKGYSSNPFHTGNNNDWKSKVFALGLRNGFRFAVHPHEGRPYPGAGMPGTIYIGEVGRFLTDEINISRGGENFGWPIFEGDELYRPDGSTIQHTPPVVPLPHPESRSVIGGVIYNGTSWPSEYRDSFLAIDFVTGWLRAFQHNADHSVLTPLEIGTGIKGVTAMAYDQTTDRVYLLGRGSDIIFTSDQGFDGLFYLRYEP